MALTAKFQADFSSFYKAVQDATAKLEGFQQEADQVSKSLDRMVDTLSGKRLISQATLMAKAVEEIGGASRLTEKELQRVSATVAEASEKMGRMGIAIPKSFKDITTAAEGVNKPTESWGSTLTSVTNIVRGFMALQIVGYIKDAAAAGLEWASSLAKMKAQTDLSYRDLQVLEDVAINTGTSLQGLTKSVQVLQERIGDRSARQGIENLGLSFDKILGMKPADQFTAIAAAIAKIENPTQRAAAAKAVLGNAYREALPAMRADLELIASQTKVIGDKQIEAADRSSARWEKFWNDQKKGWAAWAGSLMEGVEQGMSSWDKAQSRAEALRRGGVKALVEMDAAARQAAKPIPILGHSSSYPTRTIAAPNAVGGSGNIPQLTKDIKAHGEASTKAAEASRKYGEAVDASLERVNYQHFRLGDSAVKASQNVAGFTVRMSETVGISRDFSKEMNAAQIKTDHFGHVLTTNLTPSLGKVGQGLIDVTEHTVSMGDTIGDYFKKDFGKTIVSAIAGGGNPIKAALGGLGNAMFSENSSLVKNMTGGISKAFGSSGMMGKIGGMIGGMVPIIGSFIGPAIEGVTKLFNKVFGKSEETAKVSPLRDEFFKLQGGLETLNPRVEALAGNLTLVQAVFDAKTVDAYNTAIGNLNALFQEEQDAIATLTDTAAKYGLTLEELGPAMQRQQLDKQAQTLYKDWQVLNAAGIQTTVITSRMSDAINKYTNDAIAMGVEVPSAMRPMIEKMIEMGQLTDASGNKIETLEGSGISFALTMSEGFQTLIKSVDKLADVLSRSLGGAIRNTVSEINDIPRTIPINVKYSTSGSPPPKGSVPGYATGTDGFVDFGAGTLAMLHGREAVIPENAVAKFGGGGGGAMGATVSITVNAQGAFFDTPGDLQRLAEKVNDALTAKYGLTNRNRAA